MTKQHHAQWQSGRKVFGILSVWMLVLAFLIPAPASAASAAEEASFISRVNSTRASKGLAPLQTDVQLTNLARGWSTSMRDGICGAGNFICHASPISAGVTHPWAKLGENVGTGPDVGSVMDAFIASPGHYANIIDPEFTHIGVGVVWEGNRMFTTHRFMKLQGTPPTTTTTTAAPATTTTAAPVTTTTNAPTATTAAPTTTSAPATTAAPPTNDGGSPDQSSDQNTSAGDDSATDTAPLDIADVRRQPVVLLEERATVLIAAFTSVD